MSMYKLARAMVDDYMEPEDASEMLREACENTRFRMRPYPPALLAKLEAYEPLTPEEADKANRIEQSNARRVRAKVAWMMRIRGLGM